MASGQVQQSSGRPPGGRGYAEALDPANQSLAEALRKSFGVLKLLMLVLVVLYFLSGFFSVKPNEVGLKLRYGRIVGTAAGEQTSAAILPPGWHWSWPYPVERWMTVSVKNEREIPVEFMLLLTDAEKASGFTGYKYDSLSPQRDDYLITGDVNILHASVLVKYKIKSDDPNDNVVHYVRNVYPTPDPQAGLRSEEYKRYPEYTLMTNLVRDAVIETAARGEALTIRGEKQNEFLEAVSNRVNEKLREYRDAGMPLGMAVDPVTGVIAPKANQVEAILPPRQTQEVFDQAIGAQAGKAVAITKANSEAQALLVNTAGPEYEKLAQAIDAEYAAMRALSVAEARDGATADGGEVQRRQAEYEARRTEVEKLLTTAASGRVRQVLREAETARDAIIKEAAGDHERFTAVLREYLRNPGIFMSRMLNETYARALDNQQVAKVFVPQDCRQWRIKVARGAKPVMSKEEQKKKYEKEQAGLPSKPELVLP